MLAPELSRKLRSVDTPTICNALEIAMGGRTSHGFTYGTVIAAPQPLPPMLGFVRTARIKATSPSKKSAQELKKIRIDYYRYVVGDENVPTIVVMQDLDERPGTGSFWGEVNSAVHQGLKVSGVLTNGSVRDLGDLSPTFPILAGSIGPSHAHVHVVDFGCPVEVLGMAVVHDTLIHADQHGAVIIPLEYLKELPECIDRIQRKEAFLLTAARSGTFDIAALEQAMLNSEDIH